MLRLPLGSVSEAPRSGTRNHSILQKTERSKSVWVSESAPYQTISVSRPLGTKAEASPNLNDSIIMAHSFVEGHNFPKEREHGLWGKSSTQEAVSGRRWAVVSTHQSTVGLTATHLLCTLWPFLMNKIFLPHTKRLKNQKKRSLEIFILLLHKLLVWTPSVKSIKSLLLCIHGPSAFVKQ